MKVFQDVRSTAKNVPSVEVNTNSEGAIDTVYVRGNITKVNGENGEEWNIGQEIHYSAKEFLVKLTSEEDTQAMSLLIAMLMSEVDFLRVRVEELEGGKQ